MLSTPLRALRGVGPKVERVLGARGLQTVNDLLRWLPRAYQAACVGAGLGGLQAQAAAQVQGVISAVARTRGRVERLEVVLSDGTGRLTLVWFGVAARRFGTKFERGARLEARGTVRRHGPQLQMVHPHVQWLPQAPATAAAPGSASPRSLLLGAGSTCPTPPGPASTTAVPPCTDFYPDQPLQRSGAAVWPIYPQLDGVAAPLLQRLVDAALPAAAQLDEPLPQDLRLRRGLCGLADALPALHRPPPGTALEALQHGTTPWQRRLIYDELFFMQLGLLLRRAAQARGRAARPGAVRPWAGRILPFVPTAAQARVLADIEADLARGQPMQRLVQGDVGCGKTAVALVATAACAAAGLQVALMAPTELLARQHADTFAAALAPVRIRVGLLTGHVGLSERRAVLQQLAEGALHVVVGTHALIQAGVQFARLALAIIDEQHRFGVLQRAKLAAMNPSSQRLSPHVLVMTATPIPRTLALTLYGDLDVSVVNELPPGRRPVTTHLFADHNRQAAYALVRQAVERGEQAYVVLPLVEASEGAGMQDVRAVLDCAQELAEGPLVGLRLGVLHGRLAAAAKQDAMQAFARGALDVLVATTVVEVGIDVPAATVMLIEHAERFGLSQLHQLRGRVGRGSAASACCLVTRAHPGQPAWERLQVMVRSHDGFQIAEADLHCRGPGDFVGTRQSGLPTLSQAELPRDLAVLAAARADARAILRADSRLIAPEHAALRRALRAAWAGQMRLVQAG